MIVFDPRFYDQSKAVTIDPKTGLITGHPRSINFTMAWSFQGAHSRLPPRAEFPKPIRGKYNSLFRGVPDHYSDIQWSEFQPRVGIAYALNSKT